MRYLTAGILACALVAVLGVSACTAVDAGGRAVSLNALAAACQNGQGASVAQLCGITELQGYVHDDANRDLILIGRVDPSLPPLYLDDLVVVLRNAWVVYAEVLDGTRYYSCPGCSIDPNTEILKKLQKISQQVTKGGSRDDIEACLDEWRQTGESAQSVRVMGIPRDTRFAKTIVEADYHLKRLVNGSAVVDLPGFQSVADMRADRVREEIREGQPLTSLSQSLTRFWFDSGETTYCASDNAISLLSCQIRLLTEREHLAEQGVGHTGQPDPIAEKFARSFEANYPEIAARYPVYLEMQGLFRHAAIAQIMKERGAQCSGLDYLLNSHKIATTTVDRQVNGLTNVKRISEQRTTAEGLVTTTVTVQCCGGVLVDVKPRKVGAPAELSSLKKTVIKARKPANAIWWDFELE